MNCLKAKYYRFDFDNVNALHFFWEALKHTDNISPVKLAGLYDDMVDVMIDENLFDEAYHFIKKSGTLQNLNIDKLPRIIEPISSYYFLKYAGLYFKEGSVTNSVEKIDSGIVILKKLKKNWLDMLVNRDIDNFLNSQNTLFELCELEVKSFYELYKQTHSNTYKQIVCNLITEWKNLELNIIKLFSQDQMELVKETEELRIKNEIYPNQQTRFELSRKLHQLSDTLNSLSILALSDIIEKEFQIDTAKIKSICAKNNLTIFDYFVGHNQFTLKVTYNPSGIRIEQINSDDYYEITFNLIDSLKYTEQYDYLPDAQKLYKSLIGNIEENPQRLIIIPSSILQKLSFDLLVKNDSVKSQKSLKFSDFLAGNYLCSYKYSVLDIDESIFSYKYLSQKDNPDISVYAYSNDKTVKAFYKNKPIGNNEKTQALVELSGSIDELNSIEKYYSTSKIHSRSANKAHKHHFLEKIEHSKIMHLSLHGESDENSRLLNKIYFRKDDYTIDTLYPYELLNKESNADLIVLSACETNSGSLHTNNGVLSISRAFKKMGNMHIVSNIWSPYDKISSQIFDLFYKHLAASGDVLISIQRARKEFYDNNSLSNQNHPYNWAGIHNS